MVKSLKSLIKIYSSTQEGFSLVEIVLVVLAIGFLGLMIANLPSSISLITQSRHSSTARDIASKEVEFLRNQTYAGIKDQSGQFNFSDPDLGSLPNSWASYDIENCSSCTTGENVKQVTVTVSWKELGKAKQIQLTTLIGENGVGS